MFLVDIYFLLKIFVNNCWIEQQYVDRGNSISTGKKKKTIYVFVIIAHKKFTYASLGFFITPILHF